MVAVTSYTLTLITMNTDVTITIQEFREELVLRKFPEVVISMLDKYVILVEPEACSFAEHVEEFYMFTNASFYRELVVSSGLKVKAYTSKIDDLISEFSKSTEVMAEYHSDTYDAEHMNSVFTIKKEALLKKFLENEEVINSIKEGIHDLNISPLAVLYSETPQIL